MKHGFGRVARRGTGIGVAGALALTALVVPAAPASADSAIGANEEPFYSYYYPVSYTHLRAHETRYGTRGLRVRARRLASSMGR